MAREFTTVGVVGLGTMGAGIAEVFARNGFDVVGVEQDDEQLQRGRGHVQASTDRAVRRGKLDPAAQQATFDRLTLTSSLGDLKGCDLVLEAVIERLDVKRSIFQELDEIVRAETVLATNTSSLSVTEIAVATSRPGRVVGLHFFNPAPVQRLVEVVSTVVTEPGLVDEMRALARTLGKSPVAVGDRAGFIANALLFGYLNHAMSMYESRYATREDIDAAMRIGCGYPMGPLALVDLIGLDTAYQVLETMYAESRDRLHAPTPLLRRLVTAGLLGRKTGRGFYTYGDDGSVAADGETPSRDETPQLRRSIQRVGVVGSGATARGIVQGFTDGGFDVVHSPHGRELDALARADLVVDASTEDADASKAVFASLDRMCPAGVILATTTSSMPLIELAAVTSRPQDVVGLHVREPATQPALVEVVRTVATSDEVTATIQALCLALGWHPVLCGDRAGLIVDALLVPYLNDAVRMLEAHYATVDDIDTAMKQGCALPMGPFELLDELGNDVCLAMQRRLFDELPEPGLSPAPLLEQLVAAGHLGRPTGRGFRDSTVS